MKLEICSFVMNFNSGVVWWILVNGLFEGIVDMYRQSVESTKGSKAQTVPRLETN